MAKNKGDLPIVITGNEARGGVHEHRLHYVLAFGLAGGIIAFVAVGLYFGYDKLTQTISQTSLPSATLVSYAILIALAAAGTVLLVGLWNLISGGSEIPHVHSGFVILLVGYLVLVAGNQKGCRFERSRNFFIELLC
jgi:hypothetical protein